MPLQYSVTLRNNQLAQVEATVGQSPILKMIQGASPASCADAETGTVLATLTLPADWMSAPSNGSTSKLGTWQDLAADSSGTLGYFRIYDSTGTTCHCQGNITITGGGGTMTVDNTSVQIGQTIVVTTFSISCGNA